MFILDFILKFILAPHKLLFLRHNVLTTISLAVPALRLFRVTKAFRLISTVQATIGLRLVKVVGSINRGMRSLGKAMKRRTFGYVATLTLVVIPVGAAGMYGFAVFGYFTATLADRDAVSDDAEVVGAKQVKAL